MKYKKYKKNDGKTAGRDRNGTLSQNESVFDLSLFPYSDQPPPLTATYPLLKQPSKSHKAEMEPWLLNTWDIEGGKRRHKRNACWKFSSCEILMYEMQLPFDWIWIWNKSSWSSGFKNLSDPVSFQSSCKYIQTAWGFFLYFKNISIFNALFKKLKKKKKKKEVIFES